MKTSFSADIAGTRADVVEQLRELADALEGDEAVEMDLNGVELEFDLREPLLCSFELELDSEGVSELEIEIKWGEGVDEGDEGCGDDCGCSHDHEHDEDADVADEDDQGEAIDYDAAREQGTVDADELPDPEDAEVEKSAADGNEIAK